MDIGTLANWLQIISFFLPMAIFVVVWWIRREVQKVYRETKNNGGSSLRDAIDRLDRRLDKVETDLAYLRGIQDGGRK